MSQHVLVIPVRTQDGVSVGELARQLQLFPRGLRMTAELLNDFEQWTQLTEKLARHADAF